MPRWSDLKADVNHPRFFHFPGFRQGYEILVTVPSNIKFKCIRCGDCCRINSPPLNADDIKRLLAKGYQGFAEEREPENTFHQSLTGFFMKRNKKGHCWFFDDKNNKCKVYHDRPLICKTYPLDFNPAGLKATSKPTVTFIVDKHPDGDKTLCRGYTEGTPEKSDFIQFIEPLRERFQNAIKLATKIGARLKAGMEQVRGSNQPRPEEQGLP